MTNTMRASRIAMSMVLASMMLLTSLPASAATGQVLGGDSDISSNVTDAGNTARVTFDASSVLNACPTGVSGCFMEYRWRSKKDCAFCIWSADTGWIVLPSGGPTLNHCYATGNYRFELQVRLRWNSTITQDVGIYGTTENQLGIDSPSLVSKLIPKSLFNFSTGSGYGAGTQLQRNFAINGTSSAYTMATSGTTYVSTVC